MYTKKFTFLVGLVVLVLGLMSSSGGVTVVQQKDRTGSPVSDNACSQCHGGGSFTGDVMVSLLENGQEIEKYVPGNTYELKILMNHDGASKFGFQSVILDGSDASVGTYGTPSFGTRVAQLNGRTYFEQSQSLSSNEITIDWTAPAQGTGDVSVFVSGLLANGNFGTSGDVLVSSSVTFQEDQNSSTLEVSLEDEYAVYPNRSNSRINVKGLEQASQVMIFDMAGRKIQAELINGSVIDISRLEQGLHLLQIQKPNGLFKTFKFTKI